jgi:hypothetical protein
MNRRGLIGHWKYHGAVSATGTVADLSGNGHAGTLVADAAMTIEGIVLDGTGDCMLISPEITDIESITISAWIKSTDTKTIIRKGGTNAGSAYFPLWLVDLNANKLRFAVSALEDASDITLISSSTTVNDGAWHMITATRNTITGYLNVYVDGVVDATPVADGTSGAISAYLPLYIGAYMGESNDITDFCNVKIDDFRIYNRALSADEIKQIYYKTRGYHA